MYYLLYLLLPAVCVGKLYGGDKERDELMWQSAYDGNYSMAHKLALSRPCKNLNDEIIFHFVMAYVTYRREGMDSVHYSFQGVDAFLEYRLNAGNK